MQGIYIIKNTKNSNTYIGQSVDIKRRFKEHLKLKHNSSTKLKKEIAELGKENFYYEILEVCDISDFNEREKYYINILKPTYNSQKGGGAGRKQSEQTKQLLRQKGKEFWENASEETRRKIISNFKRTEYGHKVSEETKRKLREANLGKKQTEETKAKRKKTMLEKKKNGYVRDNAGHKKPIRCIETGEIFDSLKEAQNKHNLTTLCGHLKGKYKTCKGKHYEYCSVTTNDDECNRVG